MPIQLTVRIKADLHDRLKLLAITRRKKLWEIVEQSIEAYLLDIEQASEIAPENSILKD